MSAIANMPRYEAYKDSGVEWLGEIPKTWNTKRMKFLYKDTSIKNMPAAELLSVTQNQGVVPRSWVENRMVMPSGNLESFKFIEKGDFAISLRSFEGGLEYCYHDGIISPAYTVLKSRSSNLIPSFYKYLFKSYTFISELQTSVVGIREGKNVSFEELSYSLMPIPPTEHQEAIANFLDEKCDKIDEAISIKEKQIDLLKERKQILIQNAVTRGLNPDAPMRPSGIDWIGKIPAHWEVKTLKFLAKIRYGLGQPPKEKSDGLPIIRATNVERGRVTEKGLLFVDPTDIPWDRNPVLREDEIIVVRSGAYTGDSARIPKKYDGAITGYDMVMTPFSINSKFLSAAMLSKYVLFDQLYLLRMRAAQPHLNSEELGNTIIIAPPEAEQERIVKFLDEEYLKFDQAIDLQQQQIDKLKEYKSSLINSAVTGKIKVVN